MLVSSSVPLSSATFLSRHEGFTLEWCSSLSSFCGAGLPEESSTAAKLLKREVTMTRCNSCICSIVVITDFLFIYTVSGVEEAEDALGALVSVADSKGRACFELFSTIYLLFLLEI